MQVHHRPDVQGLTCRDGVSRLSAYHHMGMVSPFKVSRDVAAANNAGATRFSDEWLTWRGIAYLHCHHHWPKIDSLEVSVPMSSHLSGTCAISRHRCLGRACSPSMPCQQCSHHIGSTRQLGGEVAGLSAQLSA